MIKKTLGEKATSLILASITAIGGILVAEQVLSGEQLTSIQGLTGMILGGGSFSVITVIYVLRDLLPKKTAQNIVNNIGVDKVNKVFNVVDEVQKIVLDLTNKVDTLSNELALEREAKSQLGAYDEVSQDLKDKLKV